MTIRPYRKSYSSKFFPPEPIVDENQRPSGLQISIVDPRLTILGLLKETSTLGKKPKSPSPDEQSHPRLPPPIISTGKFEMNARKRYANIRRLKLIPAATTSIKNTESHKLPPLQQYSAFKPRSAINFPVHEPLPKVAFT